tara:strand:+ start:1374 stop:1583 length:210 start_codon:yes stop_codon:yes gene_type:complete
MKIQGNSRRSTILFVLFSLSFTPYFLPVSVQPVIFHDGISADEQKKRQKIRKMDTIVGGDAIKTGLFDF